MIPKRRSSYFTICVDSVLCIALLLDQRALLTLAITWPQGVFSEEDTHEVAAQVNGGVRHHLLRFCAEPSVEDGLLYLRAETLIQ